MKNAVGHYRHAYDRPVAEWDGLIWACTIPPAVWSEFLTGSQKSLRQEKRRGDLSSKEKKILEAMQDTFFDWYKGDHTKPMELYETDQVTRMVLKTERASEEREHLASAARDLLGLDADKAQARQLIVLEWQTSTKLTPGVLDWLGRMPGVSGMVMRMAELYLDQLGPLVSGGVFDIAGKLPPSCRRSHEALSAAARAQAGHGLPPIYLPTYLPTPRYIGCLSDRLADGDCRHISWSEPPSRKGCPEGGHGRQRGRRGI